MRAALPATVSYGGLYRSSLAKELAEWSEDATLFLLSAVPKLLSLSEGTKEPGPPYC